MRCAGCQEADGGHSELGARHDGYLIGCQSERERRKILSGDCDGGLSLPRQFPGQVLPTERCNQSGIERGGT